MVLKRGIQTRFFGGGKLAALLIGLSICGGLGTATPVAAFELRQPTAFVDAWGGMHAYYSEDGALNESGFAVGVVGGAYADLTAHTGASVRALHLEASDNMNFYRRTTTADVLATWRLGAIHLLGGLAVLDQRNSDLTSAGGWGWRVGAAGEWLNGKWLWGGGLYATPGFPLATRAGSTLLSSNPASSFEEEVYVIYPLGGLWALRGGYHGMQLVEFAPGNWYFQENEGLSLGLAARF